MQKLFKVLKQYWDILGGTLIGIVFSIIVKWQIEKVQLAYSIIILILVIIGFLKTIINDYKKDKEEEKKAFLVKEKEKTEEIDVIHKVANAQLPMKAIRISENPTKEGEELGNLFLNSMKGRKKMEKIKNFFKWIVKYKEQLIGLCGSLVYAGITVYMYIFDKFEFILKYFPSTKGWEIGVKIGVGVISLLFIIFGVRNQCKWVGLGSLEKAREYIEELGTKVGKQLSPEAKKVVTNALKSLENSLKQAKAKYNKVLAQFDAKKLEIKPVQELINLGIGDSTKLNQQLVTLSQEASVLETELKSIDKDIESLQEQISQYQHALNS